MYEMISLDVAGKAMPAMICEPEGEGPHPALVLAMHMPAHMGLEGDQFTENLIQRFADNGYLSIVPFIFHRFPLEMDRMEKLAGFDDQEIHADQEAAYQWLIDNENVDSNRVGIVGHCLGGRNAWLSAGYNPNYQVCASMWGGRKNTGWGDGNPSPLDLTAQINCPVIGIYGNDDGNPSPADADTEEQALITAGIDYEFHRYDGAGHAFMNPTSGRDPDPYRHEASEDSWNKQLAFLARHL
jgi:carboxymethylenebutenolidase